MATATTIYLIFCILWRLFIFIFHCNFYEFYSNSRQQLVWKSNKMKNEKFVFVFCFYASNMTHICWIFLRLCVLPIFIVLIDLFFVFFFNLTWVLFILGRYKLNAGKNKRSLERAKVLICCACCDVYTDMANLLPS